MSEQWAFLTSNRFWASVIGILAIYLEQKGWIGEPEKLALASLAAVFITIRTVDRLGEKMGPQPEQITLNELPVPKRRQV